ncbi:MAG: hypothetical protein AABZ06_03845 [Bdellovibrionota bacterium]
MTQLKNVKNLLLISIALFLSNSAFGKEGVFPSFACGQYRVIGQLTINSTSHFVLTLNEGSYSPFEIILLGGSFSEKMARRNTKVEVEFYVPKEITGRNRPFVYLRKLSSVPAELHQSLQKIEVKACGLNHLFEQKP